MHAQAAELAEEEPLFTHHATNSQLGNNMRLSLASQYVLAIAVLGTNTCCSGFAPKAVHLASNSNAAPTPLTATTTTALSMGLRSFAKRKSGKSESVDDSSELKGSKKGHVYSHGTDGYSGGASTATTETSVSDAAPDRLLAPSHVRDPGNYRGVPITSIAVKVASKVAAKRIGKHFSEVATAAAATAADDKIKSRPPIRDISSQLLAPSRLAATAQQSGSSVLNAITTTSVSDAEVDSLFNKYDTNSNGSIDKEEFRAVADKMRASSSRREALSVAAASFGSIFVANGSNTFQWGQKQFRSTYIEQDAEFGQQLVFPTAILSGDADRAIAKTLQQRGFTPQNTLFAHSICSDEVNTRVEELIPLMSRRWGEAFTLGGLAGLPFAGKSGFAAYFHHVPVNGKLLIMFAPHVGIGQLGKIGALQRDGQGSVSSACGAAIGAYKELQKKAFAPVDPNAVLELVKDEDAEVVFDPQLKTIVDLLKPRLEGIESSTDSIAFVTYQMYGIIRELLYGILDQTPDLFQDCSEVAVVGGVMINRRIGGDFFQPLSFETCTNDSKHIDLFETTFGERPNLVPILGSKKAVEKLFVGGRKGNGSDSKKK